MHARVRGCGEGSQRMQRRCTWAGTELSIAYHDTEWGVPLHDDRGLFEFLILEGAQAGLSWETILKKRDGYREAFDHFDIRAVAGYDGRKVRQLLRNPGIYKYNNAVVGEQIALKMNIAASDVGITAARFGDLVYLDEKNPGDPLNGISLRKVAVRVDSMLTYWRSFPNLDYNNLRVSLRKINRAFLGTIDTISLRPMKLTPVKTLFSIDFLVPNTEPPAEIPEYVALNSVPEEELGFQLAQNYPNPFNPTTTIEFNLAVPSVVTLKVYDLTGREVAALINREEIPEGFQAVDFDARSLSSGIYFYRIVANPLNEDEKGLNVVGKMILMK